MSGCYTRYSKKFLNRRLLGRGWELVSNVTILWTLVNSTSTSRRWIKGFDWVKVLISSWLFFEDRRILCNRRSWLISVQYKFVRSTAREEIDQRPFCLTWVELNSSCELHPFRSEDQISSSGAVHNRRGLFASDQSTVVIVCVAIGGTCIVLLKPQYCGSFKKGRMFPPLMLAVIKVPVPFRFDNQIKRLKEFKSKA